MGDVKGTGMVDDGIEGSSGDLLSHSFIRTWTHKGKRTCENPNEHYKKNPCNKQSS
jgi:hypothetical protein